MKRTKKREKVENPLLSLQLKMRLSLSFFFSLSLLSPAGDLMGFPK
jgi:hypothetical protein